jgi:hypothetical protein
MTTANIKFYKGATKVYPLTFTENSVAVDITNWIVFFTVKKYMNAEDDDADIKHNIGLLQDYEHTNPTEGETKVSLGASDTNLTPGNYYYDITIKKDGGDIVPVVGGTLTVLQPVTTRSS